MFMTTLILAAVSIAMNYVIFLMTKDDGKQKNKPPSKDKYNIAISQPGVAVPKIFGTVKMMGYSCVYWAITKQKRIVIKEKTLYGTKKQETPNFETFVDLHAVFSIAEIDSQIDLLQILCNDNVVYESAGGSFFGYIDKPDLFGDDDGVYGAIEYYSGSPGQVKSAYINNCYGGNASKWKRFSHMIFKNFKMTNSTSSPQFSFIFRSMPVPYWTNASVVNINGALNPSVAIYYTLIDNMSGGKMSTQAIDIEKFTAAANKLKEMEFGVAYMRQAGRPIIDEISDILEVIDANFYSDPLTGKICIELNNYTYNLEDLEHITMDDCVNYKSSRNSLSSQFTEVRVDFVNISNNFIEDSASFKNEATRLRKGKSEVKVFNYNIIPDYKTAKRVATREAIALTNSLITLDLEMSSRKISHLKVGDPVLVSLDKLDIFNMPFRIMSLNLGKLKNTTITVSLVQDRFGFFEDILSNEQEVIRPDRSAEAVACNLKVIDAPAYFNLNQNVTDNLILTFASLPNNRQQYYELWTKSSTTDYILNGQSTGFALLGNVENDIDVNDLTIDITSSLFDPLTLQKDNLAGGQNMAVIINGDNLEFINFEGVSFNSTTSVYTLINVNRGLLDTIPKQHPEGSSSIYVFSYGNAINNQDFFLDAENIKIKALTITSSNKLALSSAPEINYISTGRQKNPINVSNLKVNGVKFEETQEIGAVDLTINFSYRDKKPTIQYYDEQIISNNDLNSVVVNIYNDLNILIKTVTLSSNETSWTFDDEKTLNAGVYNNGLRVEIYTLKGSLESIDKYDIEVTRI